MMVTFDELIDLGMHPHTPTIRQKHTKTHPRKQAKHTKTQPKHTKTQTKHNQTQIGPKKSQQKEEERNTSQNSIKTHWVTGREE